LQFRNSNGSAPADISCFSLSTQHTPPAKVERLGLLSFSRAPLKLATQVLANVALSGRSPPPFLVFKGIVCSAASFPTLSADLNFCPNFLLRDSFYQFLYWLPLRVCCPPVGSFFTVSLFCRFSTDFFKLSANVLSLSFFFSVFFLPFLVEIPYKCLACGTSALPPPMPGPGADVWLFGPLFCFFDEPSRV